jgi:signal transduction histidine kinase
MLPGKRLYPLDDQTFFAVFAVLSGIGGMLIVGWGPIWFGTDLPGTPFGKAALARVFGAMLVAVGCWAASLSQMEDPELRRKGLLWFAAGHFFVLLVVISQRVAIWGPGLANYVEGSLSVAIMLFLLLWARGYKQSVGKTRQGFLKARLGGIEPLRSRYERQIREAGAQEERNRLARDLHDSIKQQIFVIQTAAATAQTRFDSDHTGAESALDQIRSSARDAMTEMEAMMDQLRSVPLENAGLIEALKKQCEALGHRTGAQVEFKPDDLPPNETLAPGSHQAILRVAQEALANIGRHARANHVTVSLDSLTESLELRVQDDGTGFDPFLGRRGMGIANMQARADEFGGQFDIISSPGGGTTVTFSIPHDEIPVRNRRRTYLYGAALAVSLFIAVWTRSPAWIIMIVMCANELARNIRDWSRAQRYAKASA